MPPTITNTYNIELSEFSLKLRRLRQDNNLSFSAAATLLDVSATRFFNLEMGHEKPTLFEKRRLNKLIAKQKIALPK